MTLLFTSELGSGADGVVMSGVIILGDWPVISWNPEKPVDGCRGVHIPSPADFVRHGI